MNSTIDKVMECPICMDDILDSKNQVITECGHIFHCSCLMRNISHNGFGCPYCRTKMAEEIADEDDEEDDDELIDDNALTSFRMFHQRIEGEEVEEEEEEEDEWHSINSEDFSEDDDSESVIDPHYPSSDYVIQQLTQRNITIEDLAKNILYEQHSDFLQQYECYEERSNQIYGLFRGIIAQYQRLPLEQRQRQQEQERQGERQQERQEERQGERQQERQQEPIQVPQIAEGKGNSRRNREYLCCN